MFTPDWNDAPEWANYVAKDDDGEWYWYENEPTPDIDSWEWNANGGRKEIYFQAYPFWGDSLQPRPKI